ncbi:MAG: Lacal_2735 family protein [Flavobacteriales bacterium]|jgi:hypothetical protein|uniref:Lacal_2735 family protein n=1 Tax=Candidatus Ulvibacter alkanivorans TaxID=2267620 RepID=UPI000DF120BF|nr:Lacal_2735 family protein [Candidatus Ulvibacter alkanivorans]MCH2489605.1 Lacal_2735 family protein [Flavobacteriales bacterium]
MKEWFKSKSRLEKLKKRYTELMKRSYAIALRDKSESDRVNRQAKKIYNEIQYLTLKQADK